MANFSAVFLRILLPWNIILPTIGQAKIDEFAFQMEL